jgi:hypothetical protein
VALLTWVAAATHVQGSGGSCRFCVVRRSGRTAATVRA